MSQQSYHISLPPSPGSNIPQIDADFGRVNVLLGINGTGKSRALRHLRGMANMFGPGPRPLVSIEGGRVAEIPPSIMLDGNSYGEFGTIERANSTYYSRRNTSYKARFRDVFFFLDRRAELSKATHSDAVTAWQQSGQNGPCPSIEESPLDRLFRMFSEIFPEITLSMDSNKSFLCRKGGSQYAPSELSDGERQVLSILADIALLAEPNSLIIADEPELNLHPSLAARVWDLIERERPDAVFIYATHNVSFAMRPSVDKLFVLSGSGGMAIQLESISDIPPEDLREFLGAIPAILASTQAIGVEGTEGSFDVPFYAWLLDKPDFAAVPLGGCKDVEAAVTRTGIWDRLASSVKLTGIVDRDFRSDAEIAQIDTRVVTLNYHEAESYLCEPKLLAAVASALGTMAHLPTEECLTEKLFDILRRETLRIAANRMAARAELRLAVSVDRSVIRSLNTEESMRAYILAESEREAKKADALRSGTSSAASLFDEEIKRCKAAIDNQSVAEALLLLPGKEVLAQFAKAVGCEDGPAVARAAYKHLDPKNFPSLLALRTQLLQSLS